MPNPKTGTVTFDIGRAVKEIKAGKIEYRADKSGIIHAPIGKVSFTHESLVENFSTLMDAVIRAKPAASKGQYLKSVTVSSTMGPGIRVSSQRPQDKKSGNCYLLHYAIDLQFCFILQNEYLL